MYLRQRLPYPTHPNSRGSEQDGPTTLSLRSLSAWFDGVRQSRTQPLQQTLRKPGSPTTRTPASQHHDDAEFKLWISDDFSLSVIDQEETIFETAVGVGRGGAPTPRGRYYTAELLRPPSSGTAYGPYAYGLSGYSDTFTNFLGGPGQLGIHGTNNPWTLGTNVSAGCVRLHNDDITYLVETLQLPLGVPVDIV